MGDYRVAEPAYDRRLMWGIVALGVLLAASLLWSWNLGNTLSRLDQRSQQFGDQLPTLASVERAEALEKRQTELETKLAALQMPDMAPVRKEIDDLATRMAGVETAVGGIKPPDLSAVQTKLDALGTRVEAIETAAANTKAPDLSAVQTKLDALGTRVDAIETAVADTKPADLSAVQTALDSLRTDLQGLRTQIGDFAPSRVDELSSRIDAMSQQVAALSVPNQTDMAAKIDQMASRLTAMETTVAGVVATGPESLQGRLDELASRIAALPDTKPLEAELGTVAADLASLRTTVESGPTADRVGAIESHVADLGNQVAESTTGLAQARTDTTALSNRVAEISAALATKAESAEVTTLTGQLDVLAKQVAALPTTDTQPLAASVAALQSRLETLEQQVTALPPADAVVTLRNDLNALAAKPLAVRPPQVLERIYFGSSDTSIASSEQGKLDAIARRLAATPVPLALVGFSDSKGPAELNRSLSLRRAAAVRLALLNAGVDPSAVTSVTGLGEDAPPVATGDNAVEAGNRVVLIYGYQ